MDTPAFGAALERLTALAGDVPTAILCAEALPGAAIASSSRMRWSRAASRCTRPGARAAEPHTLNPDARVLASGQLVYAGPPTLFAP